MNQPSTEYMEIPQDTVTDILFRIRIGNFNLFTSDQVSKLVSLKLRDGSPILTADNPSLIYELVTMITKSGFDTIYDYLTSEVWYTIDDMYFNSPTLIPYKNNVLNEAYILRQKLQVKSGAETCNRCGSTNTISMEKQIRSADEPMTTKVICNDCGQSRYVT